MKKIALTVFVFLFVLAAAIAQTLTKLTPAEQKGMDLSGKYVGKRHQYNADHKTIMQSFQYEFELKQQGDVITGVSTIIKQDGDYADIKLRGMIIADKLYFEEYEVQNQAKDPDFVWCYKSGALNIAKDGDRLKLTGSTDSYMAEYYLPCTGGFTDLTKVDNSGTFTLTEGNVKADALAGDRNQLQVFPNPFVESTKISFLLSSDAKVSLEVFDITGKRLAVLENGSTKTAGNYIVDFNAKSYNYAAGVLIAKLSVDGQIYSSEMIQMR